MARVKGNYGSWVLSMKPTAVSSKKAIPEYLLKE